MQTDLATVEKPNSDKKMQWSRTNCDFVCFVSDKLG